MTPECPTAHRTSPLVWVVGEGGLLGSEVVVASRAAGARTWSSGPIRWQDPELAIDDLTRAAATFLRDAGTRPWQVAWCAGVGVTGSAPPQLKAERRVFQALLDALAQNGADAHGAMFLASSAGGVYAGSSGAPFDEATLPVPLSPYGAAKLELEQAITDWSEHTGSSALIGRIGNLYGPGQDLTKAQGLISQVCRAQLMRQPISIYVPLDTLRHYIFAPDCATMVVAGLALLQRTTGTHQGRQWVKIMAGPEAHSIAFVLAELHRILKRRPLVVHGSSATSALQASDLRLRSSRLPELDVHARTSLVVGMNLTLEGMRGALNQGRLG